MREPQEDDDGDIMAGDRRLSRPDTALPDWHMPDASYRPIPIAWFAAAFLLQMIVLFVIFLVFMSKHGAFTIGLGSLATAMIGKWTWDRGMKDAGAGWKVATALTLGIQLAFVILGANERL